MRGDKPSKKATHSLIIGFFLFVLYLKYAVYVVSFGEASIWLHWVSQFMFAIKSTLCGPVHFCFGLNIKFDFLHKILYYVG